MGKNLIQQQKKKVEQEMDGVRKDLDDLEQMISKANLDKDTKDAQIRNLMEEIAHQDELITKVNKEKKHLQGANMKSGEDQQSIEDKCNHLNRVKGKLEMNLDELEDSLEREKKLRSDVEKKKKKKKKS